MYTAEPRGNNKKSLTYASNMICLTLEKNKINLSPLMISL